jgi:hypothetical protein
MRDASPILIDSAVSPADDAMSSRPRWRRMGADVAIPLALLAAVLAILLGAILWLNRGRFVYSFDDPYVHLALAERLAG